MSGCFPRRQLHIVGQHGIRTRCWNGERQQEAHANTFTPLAGSRFEGFLGDVCLLLGSLLTQRAFHGPGSPATTFLSRKTAPTQRYE